MEPELGYYKSDVALIQSHLHFQEKQLQIKRRFLMGLPVSKSKKEKYINYKSVPESLLRKDDMFYELVKENVAKAYGASKPDRCDNVVKEDKQFFSNDDMEKLLFSRLDALTNKGLYHIATLLTRGSIKFEITRKKLKTIIRQYFPKSLQVQNHDNGQVEMSKQLIQLLNDPYNVRQDFQSPHAAVVKVLDRLEQLPSDMLLFMRKILRGDQAGVPLLRRERHGFSRNKLIFKVRRLVKKMLEELGNRDRLQEPLAKAFIVAELSLRLKVGRPTLCTTGLNQFSPQPKTVQNDIIQAIRLLDARKVNSKDLKQLKRLLITDVDVVPDRSSQRSVKRVLTSYLFRCIDLDVIPKPLLKALAIIKRSSCNKQSRCSTQEEIEKEVESVLCLSAQTRQIAWDLLPSHDLDKEFADSYFEDQSDDDEGDYVLTHHRDDIITDLISDYGQGMEVTKSPSGINCIPEEEVGEHVPIDIKPSISIITGRCGDSLFEDEQHVGSVCNMDIDRSDGENMERVGTSGAKADSNFVKENQSQDKNVYYAIQEISDEISILAHNLIGRIMEGFALEEGLELGQRGHLYPGSLHSLQENQGETLPSSQRSMSDSVIVSAVEDLIPSFPKSSKERLLRLINS